MYVECKANGISGPAHIGRVTPSQSGKTIYYQGKQFRSLKGGGFKANYYEVGSGEEYWISGCKKPGGDRLYSGTIEIDDDVREEYWLEIRDMPGSVHVRRIGGPTGKRYSPSVSQPLTKSQQKLKGRKVTDMTVEQLKDWIEACEKMERWIARAGKARREWKRSGQEAQTELEGRLAPSP